MELLDNLNKQQKEAVMHMNGPCLVMAGAGSGKTAVLSERALRKVKENVNIDQVLILTFTKFINVVFEYLFIIFIT